MTWIDYSVRTQLLGRVVFGANNISGSGRRLVDRVTWIIHNSLKMLQEHLIHRAAPPRNNASPLTNLTSLQNVSEASSLDANINTFQRYRSSSDGHPSDASPNKSFLPQENEARPAHLSTYSNPQQYAYQTPYPSASQDYAASVQQQTQPPATSGPPQAYMTPYPQPTYQDNYSVPATDMYQVPGSPTSWRNFTGSMVPNVEPGPGETMSSASALMQLGSAPREMPRLEQVPPNVTSDAQVWPF